MCDLSCSVTPCENRAKIENQIPTPTLERGSLVRKCDHDGGLRLAVFIAQKTKKGGRHECLPPGIRSVLPPCVHFAFAQTEAFMHSTTPSITLFSPALNPSSSNICLFATAPEIPNAALTNDMTACFFSPPLLLPSSASTPCTTAGINEIPRNKLDRKIISASLSLHSTRSTTSRHN